MSKGKIYCAHCIPTGIKYIGQTKHKSLYNRMEAGYKKYGVTTERKDIDLMGWLQHLQEELMDASIYVERIKSELKAKQDDFK